MRGEKEKRINLARKESIQKEKGKGTSAVLSVDR